MTLKKPIRSLMIGTLLFCLLSGCAGGQSSGQTEEHIRKNFEELSGFSAEVKILSDLGESTLEYSGVYVYNREDTDTFTLKTPESLAGIEIAVSGEHADNLAVQYGDTLLDTGMPVRAGATPADVIPLLLHALRTDLPKETWEEAVGGVKMLAARYETEDPQGKITRQVWLTRDSLRPSYAECFVDSARVLQVFFQYI